MHTTELDLREANEAAVGGAGKREYVRRMFSEIAPTYDRINQLLSFNIDRGWRRRAVAALEWRNDPRGTYLDLCAGTLGVASMLARTPGFDGHVVGADFAEPMLRAGLDKTPRDRVQAVASDALALPMRDASLAGAIVSFGIRNVAGLDAGLREVARVLRPGARFVILEFSSPDSALVRSVYRLYCFHVLPLIAGALSGHRTAYRYLPASVAVFPDRDALAERMRAAGFADVTWRPLTFGVVAIHVGRRAAGA